ncbi:MAG: ROK family protein, partial [Fidelibacterota bacterium]
MATNFLMGIDLGGSKIYTLIVSPRGEIVGRSKSKTPQQASFGDIVQTIKDRLDAALAESGLSMRRIHAVGMGVPGPVDSQGRV